MGDLKLFFADIFPNIEAVENSYTKPYVSSPSPNFIQNVVVMLFSPIYRRYL